jgi:hypothetical protein
MSKVMILAPNNQNESELDNVFSLSTCQPFAGEVLSFIQSLSEYLLKSEECKAHSELVALGFWLRKSNMKQIQKSNAHQANVIQKALGTVLHFTPSNVDSMFAYSWICSLLMGNSNIVRVASAESQVKLCLLSAINLIFSQAKFTAIAQRNLFVSYPKESSLTVKLSAKASARVIWGGDESVQAIRAIPSHPRCRDISFADRYSACLINGDELQTATQVDELATKLWRDTEPHAQQACSSPRIIYWLGAKDKQLILFQHINALAIKHRADLTLLNNHLVVSQLIQSRGQGYKPLVQQAICVLKVDTVNSEYLDWHLGNGLFLLKNLNSEQELVCKTDSKLQTLSYWKVDKDVLLKLIQQPSTTGIDRVVPVGHSLDFSTVWDGFELFGQLSRSIVLE